MTERKAILSIEGEAPIELPVLKGTLGQDVVDIGSLGSHGFFTYDPGFSATAACQSDITYIDGEKGVLLHRGYPIEELAEKSGLPVGIKSAIGDLEQWKELAQIIKNENQYYL